MTRHQVAARLRTIRSSPCSLRVEKNIYRTFQVTVHRSRPLTDRVGLSGALRSPKRLSRNTGKSRPIVRVTTRLRT